MNHDAVVLEIVSVIRVAIGAGLVGFTGRNSRQGAGEKTSTAGIGPTGMCGGPNLIVPSNDIAFRIHSATYFHYHGRPKGSHACSSCRIHCTRTGFPTAWERSAASPAASSAPLWP